MMDDAQIKAHNEKARRIYEEGGAKAAAHAIYEYVRDGHIIFLPLNMWEGKLVKIVDAAYEGNVSVMTGTNLVFVWEIGVGGKRDRSHAINFDVFHPSPDPYEDRGSNI